MYSTLTQEQALGSDQSSQSQSSSCSGSDAGLQTALRDQLGMLISALPTTVMNGTHSPKREVAIAQNGLSPEHPGKRTGILGKGNFVFMFVLFCILLFCSVLVSKTRLTRASSSPGFQNHLEEPTDSSDTVLIIPLLVEENEHIGLLTEQKVLNMTPVKDITKDLENLRISNSIENLNLVSAQDCEERDRLPDQTVNSGQEKRTRFSHSHDEGSIGNTSDNLEAISEAASNHSVASSLELENEDQNDNDNLSDMVSANVSGRGTPNISGRDTPSSQVTEGEERQNLEVRQVYLPPPQSLIGKQIRSEIDDKFCKFEIKKLLEGDETISIISDTWSTDVLASDSETIEQHDRANIPPIVEQQSIVEPVVQQLLDVLETASESAWSTDVFASDSERLTEVDTDDTASVARSDDTARSEIEDNLAANVAGDQPPIPPVVQPINPFLNDNIIRPVNNVFNSHPQSPSVGYMFRPVREDMPNIPNIPNIPNSPTRNDFHPNFNVTGRGGRKSDYRRRTVEYVDSNANNVVQNNVLTGENNRAVSTGTIVERMSNHVEMIERGILRIHNIENISSRREAIIIDPNVLNSNGLQLLNDQRKNSAENVEESPVSNDIVMGAVAPAFLLANHVGAQKYIPKPKNENDGIRSSNVSLNSMSSSSSSASESRNKLNNGAVGVEITAEIRPQWNLENKPCQWLNNGSSDNITSTPSGSTSELSVLSPTNVQLSPVIAPNKIVNNTIIKPSTSTGAIPKSISFDMTAEKGDKELDDDKKNNRGFFGKLRMGFRNRRGKSLRGDDLSHRYETDGDGIRYRRLNQDNSGRILSAAVATNNGEWSIDKILHFVTINCVLETSEDILAKYRRKPSNTSDTNTIDSTASSVKSKGIEVEDDRLIIDPSNVEGSFAFVDTKKKLRLVLSTSDCQFAPLESSKVGNIVICPLSF